MRKINDLDTPCVLIDIDRVEANLARAQAHADANGYKLRPHIKTHKLPRFAKRAVELGAVGITVQKLGEAEVMADAGLDRHLPPLQHCRPGQAGAAEGAQRARDARGHGGQPGYGRRLCRDVSGGTSR